MMNYATAAKNNENRNVISDLRNQRKAMQSVLSTTSEREILGLKGRNVTAALGQVNSSGYHSDNPTNYIGGNIMQRGNFNNNNTQLPQHSLTLDQSPMQSFLKNSLHQRGVGGLESLDLQRSLPVPIINTKLNQSLTQNQHKRNSILQQQQFLTQSYQKSQLQNSKDELPLLTGFIINNDPVGGNSQLESKQKESWKPRHKSVLQTSDPLQLQILRGILDRKETQETNHNQSIASSQPKLNMQNKNQGGYMTFSTLQQNDEIGSRNLPRSHFYQQQQSLNSRNSQSPQINRQNNNLMNSMKTGVQSQASLVFDPQMQRRLHFEPPGSRLQTDIDTDGEEKYFTKGSLEGGYVTSSSQIIRQRQQQKQQQQQQLSQMRQNTYQSNSTPQLNNLDQLELDKERLLQQIDALILKKKLARDLERLEELNQKIENSRQSPQSLGKNNSNYNTDDQINLQLYTDVPMYISDYQSQIGSSYPSYLLEKNPQGMNIINQDFAAQFLLDTYPNGEFSRNQQNQQFYNSYNDRHQMTDLLSSQKIPFQAQNISNNPQILVDSQNYAYHPHLNLPTYQHVIKEKEKAQQFSHQHKHSLQQLSSLSSQQQQLQYFQPLQQDILRHKVNQILGSANKKHRRPSLITEQISEREELAFEMMSKNDEDSPMAKDNGLSRSRLQQYQALPELTKDELQTHQRMSDVSISPIETEIRPTQINQENASNKAVCSPNAHIVHTQQMNQKVLQSNNSKGEKITDLQFIQEQRRNTVDSTNTDYQDMRILEREIQEGLRKSAENNSNALKQIRASVKGDRELLPNKNLESSKSKQRIPQNVISMKDIDNSDVPPISVQITQPNEEIQVIPRQMREEVVRGSKNTFQNTPTIPGFLGNSTKEQTLIGTTLDGITNSSPSQQLNSGAVKPQLNKDQEIQQTAPLDHNQNRNIQTQEKTQRLSYLNNHLSQFKASGQRISDSSTAKSYLQIVQDNESKEMKDLEELLRTVDGLDSTKQKRVSGNPFNGAVLVNGRFSGVAGGDHEKHSKMSSNRNQNKDDNQQSYETFTERFNSSRRNSLQNNLMFQQLVDNSSGAKENGNQGNKQPRESIQIELIPAITPKGGEQKDQVENNEVEALKNPIQLSISPQKEKEDSDLERSPPSPQTFNKSYPQLDISTNVIEVNIVPPNYLSVSPQQKLNLQKHNTNSFDKTNSLENSRDLLLPKNKMSAASLNSIINKNKRRESDNGQNSSFNGVLISRMPYQMKPQQIANNNNNIVAAEKKRGSINESSNIRGSFIENNPSNGKQGTTTPKPQHSIDQSGKIAGDHGELSSNAGSFIIPHSNQHHIQKTVIVLKGPATQVTGDQFSTVSETLQLPQPAFPGVTSITMLAPTMDAILDPLLQEISQQQTAIPPQEKIFKKGRNARGKRMFAQNILFKLAKPRKQLDPEEVEKMLLAKEQEERDAELEELKAQSSQIPQPPRGKRRYIDYLIKQNSSSRPEDDNEQDNQVETQQLLIPKSSARGIVPKPAEHNSKALFVKEVSNMALRNSKEREKGSLIKHLEQPKGSDFRIQLEETKLQNTSDIHKHTSNNEVSIKDQRGEQMVNEETNNHSSPGKPQLTSQKTIKKDGAQLISSLKSGMNKFIKKQQQSVSFMNQPEFIMDGKVTNNQISPIRLENQQDFSNFQGQNEIMIPIPVAKARQTYGVIKKQSTILAPAFLASVANTKVRESSMNLATLVASQGGGGEGSGPQAPENNNKVIAHPRLRESQMNLPLAPRKRESEQMLRVGNKIRESTQNLAQLGLFGPNMRKQSSSILAPPEFKHSKIDVQILQTTLDTPKADFQRHNKKQSTQQQLVFSSPTIKNASNEVGQEEQVQNKFQHLSTLGKPGYHSQFTNKSFSPQRIPKQHISSSQINSLSPRNNGGNGIANTSVENSNHEQMGPKKSTKVLPKLSTTSISSIGRFMRGQPNRGSMGGDFQIGQMHGKNF